MKTTRAIASVLLALVAAVSIFAGQRRSAAHVQDSQMSKITGVVVDVNDARIVSARVRIKNEEFGLEVRSDDEGKFAAEVPAGVYQITVEAAGFQRVRLFSVRADAQASESVNIRMKVAQPRGLMKVE